MKQVRIKAPYSRRFPDPVFTGCERHIFMCRAEDLPSDIPDDPNPREQNVDRGIYRTIQKHLLNVEGEPNTFHLKNKGITLLASKVTRTDDDETFILHLSEEQGILDGAHTYDLIIKNQKEIISRNNALDDPVPGNDNSIIKQFVKLEVLTGYSQEKEFITEITGGLNTAVQVQQMSLADLKDEFEWIKEELRNEPYYEHIAFRENEDKPYDIRDILVMLELFNITDYSNDFSSQQKDPIRAYNNKENVLSSYHSAWKDAQEEAKRTGSDRRTTKYEKLRPILKDILRLHDTIDDEAKELYNKAEKGRYADLKFVEQAPKGKPFPRYFIGKQGDCRLYRSAILPILGAFRFMVLENPATGAVEWRGGFSHVLDVWRLAAPSMLRDTKQTCADSGYTVNAIGKTTNHWRNMRFTVLQAEAQLNRDMKS